MASALSYGSVCSGIEAATLAWKPLGWRAAWFSEIESFPCAVLKHHYPHTPNLGDMTRIAARVRDGNVEAPDILVGGTPCQAFSLAGLRGGLSDPRGALTLAYVDLANALDSARSATGRQPCIAVWENVPGVLSSKDNAFGCFLGALAGEDCELKPPGPPPKPGRPFKWSNAGCVFGPQRTVAWRTLDAQYFGVAQRRRRVFVVASDREWFDPAAVLFESEGVRRDSAPRRGAPEDAASTIAGGARKSGGYSYDDVPLVAKSLGASNGGIDREDRHTIIAAYGGNNSSGSIDIATARNACASASASGRMDFETETFLVQAFAENSRAEVRLENGDGQITGALKVGGGKPGQSYQVAMIGSSVRRLTPTECERLQDMPDDYTLVPHGTNRAKDFSEWLEYLRLRLHGLTEEEARLLAADGPRYKAIGNSFAVPVVRWIGQRIQAVLAP